MAKLPELAEGLFKRFKDVPNVAEVDVEGWIERSMLEHGYLADSDIPPNRTLLILLYAEWDGAMQIALKTAFYFQYKDSEETVDKRNVSEQYRRLAAELWKTYERKKLSSSDGSSTRFSIMTRADIPTRDR